MIKSVKLRAFGKTLFGALLLLNAFVWPQWLGIDGWIKFAAVLMVIFGLVHLISLGFCKKPVKAAKKRKK
jgi:hypothetical protein